METARGQAGDAGEAPVLETNSNGRQGRKGDGFLEPALSLRKMAEEAHPSVLPAQRPPDPRASPDSVSTLPAPLQPPPLWSPGVPHVKSHRPGFLVSVLDICD